MWKVGDLYMHLGGKLSGASIEALLQGSSIPAAYPHARRHLSHKRAQVYLASQPQL